MSHKLSRRGFLTQTSLAAVGVTALGVILPAMANAHKVAGKQPLMHFVLYYLKNPDSVDDKQKLIAGLKELVTVKQIKTSHVGVPMEFKADDPFKNYHVSLLMIFDDKGDIDIYHKDPIHQKFVADCKDLWVKTLKYDSLGG
jgi:hypothetical protein